MSPVPGADTDHRWHQGEVRGVDRDLLLITLLLKLINLSPPVITIADASAVLQTRQEHLSIRVASAGVRCLVKYCDNFYCEDGSLWPLVSGLLTNEEAAGTSTGQWEASTGSWQPVGEQLRVSPKWGAQECGDRQLGVSRALSLLFTFIRLNNKMSEWWKNCKITLFLCGGHYFECKYELWCVNTVKGGKE